MPKKNKKNKPTLLAISVDFPRSLHESGGANLLHTFRGDVV